jgi:5-methylcytosine-specific restriction endonuclease McrA
MRSKSARRRARRLNAFVEHVDKKTLYQRDLGICGICKGEVAYAEATIDHVIPLSRHGLHSYANTAVAHGFCNLYKGSLMPEDIDASELRILRGRHDKVKI